MQLCQSCGVTAPQPGETCFVCRAPAIPDPPIAPPAPDGMCWCRLWGHFKCRSCGFEAPINFVDADGGLACSHCGIDQAFDVQRWTSVLQHAHEVADLAGPAPETRASSPDVIDVGPPRFNAHPQIYSWTEVPRRHGQLELTWACAVGYPLCAACHAPLRIDGDGQGQVITVCTRCGRRATYGSLDVIRGLYPQTVAVLADEHRTDVSQVNELQGRSTVTVECPKCGAPISASSAPLQSCDHCGATVRVPQHFRTDVAMEPFWILFDGPSSARRELEEDLRNRRIQDERDERDRRERMERLEAVRRDKAEAERNQAQRLAEITCPLCMEPELNDRGWCECCGYGKPWHIQNSTMTGFLAGVIAWVIVAVLDIFLIKPPFPGIGVGFYLIMAAAGSIFLGVGVSMAIDPTGHTISSTDSSGHTTSSRPATSGDGVFFAIASIPFYFVALFLGPILGP